MKRVANHFGSIGSSSGGTLIWMVVLFLVGLSVKSVLFPAPSFASLSEFGEQIGKTTIRKPG